MASKKTEGGRLFFQSETFETQKLERRKPTGRVVEEPAQTVPVHTECDVLVVGGGPSGTAAAVAAARMGADVVLLERYNHLGGLSTGGLVIWIDRMTDWTGKLVIRGFAEEILSRLTREKIAGPVSGGLGIERSRQGRVLGAAHRRLPRDRDLLADARSGMAEG